MNLSQQDKQKLFVIGVIIVIVAVILVFLKFWVALALSLASFAFGYYQGRKSMRSDSWDGDRRNRNGFL